MLAASGEQNPQGEATPKDGVITKSVSDITLMKEDRNEERAPTAQIFGHEAVSSDPFKISNINPSMSKNL